jgi:hypothetical protein
MYKGMAVNSKIWDGSKVSLIGAKNEVLGFQLILEAPSAAANKISISLSELVGPSGFKIAYKPAAGDDLFKYVGRDIELFYVGYLQIKGLSALSYDTYDERHIPKRFQRTMDSNGVGSGLWSSRPDANKFYPDIMLPLELKPEFNITGMQNQAIWIDIYVPKAAPAGSYSGNIQISEAGVVTKSIPIALLVKNFALPDVPNAKTMLYMGYPDINNRYLGNPYPNANTAESAASLKVRNNHFMVAHRHKISMIDAGLAPESWSKLEPRPEWLPRLNGSAYTAANGYAGPGENTGNGVYSIGTYGQWNWTKDQPTMLANATTWENWFKANAPATERFLYLIDESTNFPQTEQWAAWIKPSGLKTFATIPLNNAEASTPSLSIATSWIAVAPLSWETSWSNWLASGHNYWMYNGKRPASPSFATEEDGVGLRILPWVQYKKKISRWFFWESTYYNNYQGGQGQTNVFQSAFTFGGKNAAADSIKGETGWNYCNGDGVLFYPGTDKVFPAESLGLSGPLASYRMKMWRRGIQDVDYLAMAAAKDPIATQALVNKMLPKVLWENGVSVASDPTWWRGAPSWSIKADDWEQARLDLIAIIEK